MNNQESQEFVNKTKIKNIELTQEFYVEEKNYKAKNTNIITNSNVRFMFPGNLRVARCFSFFGGIL